MGADAFPDQRPEVPEFAIWRAPAAPDDVGELAAVLRGDGAARSLEVESLEALLRTEAQVLVLRGGYGHLETEPWDDLPSDSVLNLLRERRVLGMGTEAGKILGALGLPVDGDCASFRSDVRSAWVCASPLTPSEMEGLVIETHEPPPPRPSVRHVPNDLHDLTEAAFLPAWSYEARVVEPLLRWTEAPNHAPVVGRSHYAWTGIGYPVASWSPSYSTLIRQVAAALTRIPVRPLVLPWPDIASSGTHVFDLDACDSAYSPFCRSFFLAPPGAVRLRASLDGPGTGGLMLLLHAGVDDLEGVRLDRKGTERLEFEQLLLSRSLAANPARCWEIAVTNFGSIPLRGVTLRIEVDASPELRLPGGNTVSLSTPITDEGQVAQLVEAYAASDPASRSDIAQFLAESPGVAGRHLYGIMRRLQDPDRCGPYEELLLDLKAHRHRPRAPWPRESA